MKDKYDEATSKLRRITEHRKDGSYYTTYYTPAGDVWGSRLDDWRGNTLRRHGRHPAEYKEGSDS